MIAPQIKVQTYCTYIYGIIVKLGNYPRPEYLPTWSSSGGLLLGRPGGMFGWRYRFLCDINKGKKCIIHRFLIRESLSDLRPEDDDIR